VALLVFGFGVKLALPGLHFWLPLAYPAAPVAGAAVLSGPMINAGLLGWLRFLPPGTPALQHWGEPLMLFGAAGVALGVLAGVLQRDPRTVLGYSSIAKMGLVSLLFGTALGHPEAATGIASALVLFAVHHSLVKSALFLGVGEWQRLGPRPWVLAAVGGLALTLAGAPFTGGAAAKSDLSSALAIAGVDLGLVMFLAAIGTFVLMARFLWLLARAPTAGAGLGAPALAWLALAVPALWLPYGSAGLEFSSAAALLPLGLGAVLAALAWVVSRRGPPRRWDVPPGDFLHLLPRWRPRRLPDLAPGVSGLERLADLLVSTLASPRELSGALAGLVWLGLFALLLGALLLPW
jgi:formate hydrogenlyase subunit 3/multisubunit Na+/H+ antiporter MnhD subunit